MKTVRQVLNEIPIPEPATRRMTREQVADQADRGTRGTKVVPKDVAGPQCRTCLFYTQSDFKTISRTDLGKSPKVESQRVEARCWVGGEDTSVRTRPGSGCTSHKSA